MRRQYGIDPVHKNTCMTSRLNVNDGDVNNAITESFNRVHHELCTEHYVVIYARRRVIWWLLLGNITNK